MHAQHTVWCLGTQTRQPVVVLNLSGVALAGWQKVPPASSAAVTQPSILASFAPNCGMGTSSTSATSLKQSPVRLATKRLYVAGSWSAGPSTVIAVTPEEAAGRLVNPCLDVCFALIPQRQVGVLRRACIEQKTRISQCTTDWKGVVNQGRCAYMLSNPIVRSAADDATSGRSRLRNLSVWLKMT